MEETKVKDCRDCKFCCLDLEDFYCCHPKSMEAAPGIGKGTNAFRSENAPCGPNAVLFEPRKDNR